MVFSWPCSRRSWLDSAAFEGLWPPSLPLRFLPVILPNVHRSLFICTSALETLQDSVPGLGLGLTAVSSILSLFFQLAQVDNQFVAFIEMKTKLDCILR